MKKDIKKSKPVYLTSLKTQLISGIAITVITSTIAFAWNTNGRLTRLETAMVSLASDVHDIKQILMDNKNGE